MVAGISQIVGIVKEPLRAYNFEVDLPRDFGDADRLKYQVRSAQFPVWFNLEVQEVRVEALGYYFLPSNFEVRNEVKIDFWEDAELSVQRYFNDWRNMIVGESVSGTLYRELKELPSKWMRDVGVYLIDGKGERVGSYRLRKCYPVGIDALRLGYEANEVVVISVSLIVHGIEIV